MPAKNATAPPDIVTWVPTPDTTYWRGHPDVVEVDAVSAPDEGEERYELRLWLRAAPEDAIHRTERWFGAKAPARPPEFEIFVEGRPRPTFTERLPALGHIEVFCESGDEVYPEGWWVARIWLLDG